MPSYVYVLRSLTDGKLYTGSTNNLKRRIGLHSKGLIYSTKHRRPFQLIYYECGVSEKDARAREKYLKSGRGKRYLKARLKYFLNLERDK
ncbi:MAG: GIY-YIG nuclease family protein [Patescibacteria group bacterium]|nr:GIY-YIG nuclease family protein [Patescibacteria group bacterium]MCL5261679.1 GIY-YIG nuclease family protein [Patescibacteria group bacterium]